MPLLGWLLTSGPGIVIGGYAARQARRANRREDERDKDDRRPSLTVDVDQVGRDPIHYPLRVNHTGTTAVDRVKLHVSPESDHVGFEIDGVVKPRRILAPLEPGEVQRVAFVVIDSTPAVTLIATETTNGPDASTCGYRPLATSSDGRTAPGADRDRQQRRQR